MSQEKFMKITYHDGERKLNAYLKMPSPVFSVLKREISMCLFDERKLPACELKTYWIDEDNDEIEIFNQCDYEVFMAKRSIRQHLQVAPVKANSSDNVPPSVDDPSAFVIHDRVACDACNAEPIIGFRYKCVECQNYDLCQRCEAQHKHPEHLMLRIPNENCPQVSAYWEGIPSCTRGSGRRSKRDKKAASACPFMPFMAPPQNEAEVPPTAETDKHHSRHHHHDRHDRKHRRQMRNGVFMNLYEIMQDLANGGPAARQEEAAGTSAGATAGTAAAGASATAEANAQAANANEAAKAAREAAIKAAEVAAKVVEQTAKISASVVKQASEDAATIVDAVEHIAEPKKHENTEATAPEQEEGGAWKPEPTTENTKYQQTSDNEEVNVFGLDTPAVEELVKLIDPKYMKAGIQLLSNFSEMVGRILDPVPDPDNVSAQESGTERKQSTCSSTSCTSNRSSMSTASTAKNLNLESYIKENEPKAAAEPQKEKQNDNAKDVNEKPIEKAETDGKQRAQSEEHGWTLIDKNASESSVDLLGLSAATSTESIEPISKDSNASEVVGSTPPTPAPTPAARAINFEQLSMDLKEHVEKEKLREEAEKQKQQQKVVTTAVTVEPVAPKVAVAENKPTTSNPPAGGEPATSKPAVKETKTQTQTQTANASTSTGAINKNSPKPKKEEEPKRKSVYHSDERINNAVHAMMAMGFSNEGAFLTQLLESVNGNISEALDLMTAAQRSPK